MPPEVLFSVFLSWYVSNIFTKATTPSSQPRQPHASPRLPVAHSPAASDERGAGRSNLSSLTTPTADNAQYTTIPPAASLLTRGRETLINNSTAHTNEQQSPASRTGVKEKSITANTEQKSYRPATESPGGEETPPSELRRISSTKQHTPEKSPPDNVVFLKHAVVRAEDMDRCFEANGKLVRRASNVEIAARYSPVEVMDIWMKPTDPQRECSVDMTVPLGKAIKIQVIRFNSTCDNSRRLLVVESRSLHTLIDMCKDGSVAGEFSVTEHVTVRVVASRYTNRRQKLRNRHLFVLHMNLSAVDLVKDLEVNLTTNRGAVQTPRWDGHVHYPHSMNSKVKVNIPVAHAAMLSFEDLQIQSDGFTCSDDYLQMQVYRDQGGVLGVELIPRFCGVRKPRADVYRAYALVFVFVSNAHDQRQGFRALFSFHGEAASPEKVPGGGKLWNCSVPYWPDFSFHFPCNLESDCAGSEDEEFCEYTSAACGTGVITAGDGCYLLVNGDGESMWYQPAQDGCEARGARLASINTQGELLDVWRVLQKAAWRDVILGLQLQPSLPDMYRDMFLWTDGSVAYFLRMYGSMVGNRCFTSFDSDWREPTLVIKCRMKTGIHYLCELPNKPFPSAPETTQPSKPTHPLSPSHYVRCPAGHLTHSFLACDVNTACFQADDTVAPSSFSCPAPVESLPPHFRCEDKVGYVPYSLLCDHIQDCTDGSDETFCVFPTCAGFQCRNQQCIPASRLCYGQHKCLDGSHKDSCKSEVLPEHIAPPSPGLVHMDVRGLLRVVDDPRLALTSTGAVTWECLSVLDVRGGISIHGFRDMPPQFKCPETHFECPATEDYYCLPIYLLCNGMYDCPRHEDEAGCSNFTCVGFYRCRGSRVCLHPDHLCDGYVQCPQHDDEALCHLQCPPGCTCHGVALKCAAQVSVATIPELTYLDARDTGMTFASVYKNTMLVYLNLARCRLTRVPNAEFPNMKTLDLSDNLITSLNVTLVRVLPALRFLSLSGNPVVRFYANVSRDSFGSLLTLDLSWCALSSLDVTNLTVFFSLRVLNLSSSGVDTVSEEGFRAFTKLRTLDLRGCSMSVFPPTILQGLDDLSEVYADNFKLCCPNTLPVGFPLSQCQAPSDEISSCDTLLRSDFFRLFLYVFAGMALLGNSGSFVYRMFVNRSNCNQGFGVFVTNLCMSDFLMGVYLTTIGVADRMYMGSYLWEDVRWRNSTACKLSGFLSLLSCEVSALVICLITLDRFLVLRFPFSHVRFTRTSARSACALVWLLGLVIAVLPLLPFTARWEFYKQSSICIPLPVTRRYFPGFGYSFGVMIVLNSVLFVLIAAGQASIYHSIRINSISMADMTKSSSKDLTIARRLITVAMSDFFCWFPIGFLGVMASQNVPIPGQVNVAIAIFVLPLNSAVNPFLYTLNVVKERRQRAQLQRLKALFQGQSQLKTNSLTADETRG